MKKSELKTIIKETINEIKSEKSVSVPSFKKQLMQLLSSISKNKSEIIQPKSLLYKILYKLTEKWSLDLGGDSDSDMTLNSIKDELQFSDLDALDGKELYQILVDVEKMVKNNRGK